MEFSAVEWDEAKGRTNLGKHKIDFTDAAGVFGDPDQLTFRSEYRPPRPRASHAGTNGNVMKKNKSSERNRDEDVVTLVASLPDETSVLEHADGRPERSKSQTDWAALDALTDEAKPSSSFRRRSRRSRSGSTRTCSITSNPKAQGISGA
jgi:uncharacterized DUF497 family protein